MYKLYLVTGGTGYLGAAVIKRLIKEGAAVRALVMPGDRLAKNLPAEVSAVPGRVDDAESLLPFFDGAGDGTCVIHCAGIVSIASKPGEALRRVNVGGTRNIVGLCVERKVSKLVYVSSVHAIPERPKGESISEVSEFSPELVSGDYAKSKAEATCCALEAAKGGLDASVVHPSGIIGPNDSGQGSITGMILAYCAGKLPVGVRGGYDFVDVRDVADGILSCCDRGKPGECYILSNRFVSVRELLETLKKLTNGRRVLMYLPLSLAKLAAPLCEKLSIRRKKPLYFTPYSIETLGTNAVFSHDRATRVLGYHPRDIARTLADTVVWLRRGRVPEN